MTSKTSFRSDLFNRAVFSRTVSGPTYLVGEVLVLSMVMETVLDGTLYVKFRCDIVRWRKNTKRREVL